MAEDTAAAREFAQALARELGVVDWHEQLETYRRAERAIMPIEIKVGAEPKFFPFIDERQREEWNVRASLVNAAALKKLAPSYDKLFPNDEAIGLAKADLQMLLDKPGVLHALSLYVSILKGDIRTGQDVDLRDLFADRAVPKSFYEVKDASDISRVRNATEGWLTGNLGLDRVEAGDAEHIAWNLLYLSNVIEWGDSELPPHNRPSGTTNRLKPIPGVKSVATWMMMHPEERLAAKIGGEETWSVLGEWALDNQRRFSGWTPAKEDILPDTMFPTVFHEVRVDDRNSLYGYLLHQGRELIVDPTKVLSPIDWDKVGENPFSAYYYDKVNPAIQIFGVIDKGMTDKSYDSLGTACRKLGLDKKYRMTLLIALNGVDVKAKNLKYYGGLIEWAGIMRGVDQLSPNFFT